MCLPLSVNACLFHHCHSSSISKTRQGRRAIYFALLTPVPILIIPPILEYDIYFPNIMESDAEIVLLHPALCSCSMCPDRFHFPPLPRQSQCETDRHIILAKGQQVIIFLWRISISDGVWVTVMYLSVSRHAHTQEILYGQKCTLHSEHVCILENRLRSNRTLKLK